MSPCPTVVKDSMVVNHIFTSLCTAVNKKTDLYFHKISNRCGFQTYPNNGILNGNFIVSLRFITVKSDY